MFYWLAYLMITTHGLLGTFNGNASDDFLPKDSLQPLPLSSSLQTIHTSFGLKCELLCICRN